MAKFTKSKGTKASKRAVKKSQTPSKKQTSKPSRKSPKSTKAVKTAKTSKPSPKFKSPVPRSASNPFRAGSSYGICYDLLASKPEGLPRQELIEALAKVTGKPVKNAGFDAAVVLSPTESGKRHSSCRGTYTVQKTNDHVKLRTE